MLFVCYPKCTTCQKARAFLDAKGAAYGFRDIKTDNPAEVELRTCHTKSALQLKRFFNSSGLQCKALELSKTMPTMTENEQYTLLATDGMLVKRPILGFWLAPTLCWLASRRPRWSLIYDSV